MKKAIFAGSFDPIHLGHKKIIKKAASIFDEVFVVVANNNFKNEQGNISERLETVEREININNVKVFILKEKYLGDFAKKHNISYLVRSARNNIDFEYELDMAKLNRKINKSLETILIIPDYDDIKFSSKQFRDFKVEGK